MKYFYAIVIWGKTTNGEVQLIDNLHSIVRLCPLDHSVLKPTNLETSPCSSEVGKHSKFLPKTEAKCNLEVTFIIRNDALVYFLTKGSWHRRRCPDRDIVYKEQC